MNGTNDDVWCARVDLAAANRLAVYDDLEEGIDNHFTMRVPEQDDRYLVLPFGMQAERETLYFAGMMRVPDREMPGYAD